MTQIFNKTVYKNKRRNLRQVMPLAEKILWSRLRSKQLKGYKFRRQYSIGFYIVDFYAPKAKLVIEVDGESHMGEQAEMRDESRQEYIESLGITCLRFTNWDVYENIDGVLEAVIAHLS